MLRASELRCSIMSRGEVKPVMHGGDLDAAQQNHPKAPQPWIDLSTGVNPHAYPLPDIAPQAWTRLPLASDALALRTSAARRYGAADPTMVVAAPGTQALIQIIPRLLPPSRVRILGPTYGEHARCWAMGGHHVQVVETLAALQDDQTSVVVVVNPNNPTGALLRRQDLQRLADRLKRRGGLLVVDEAFIDAGDGQASLVPSLPAAALVLRSFGKIYGLAGLRLGFAIADRSIAQGLADMLGPWSVPGPTLEIAQVALADTDWLHAARTRLLDDSARLDALLTAAGGVPVGGTPLFRLARFAEARTLAHTLGEHGILVRGFTERADWLRFGLPGTADAWRRLQVALAATPGDAARRRPG